MHLDFHGTHRGAFSVYVLGGLLVFITGFLTIPLVSKWTWRYVMNNLSYGGRPFRADPSAGAMYRKAVIPFLLVVVASVLAVIIVFGIQAAFPDIRDIFHDGMDEILASGLWVILIGFYAFVIFFYLLIGAIYRAGVRNVGVSATTIDDRHSLASAMNRFKYAWIV